MIGVQVDLSPALADLIGKPAVLVHRAGVLAAKRAAEVYVEAIHEWVKAGRSFTPRTGRLMQETGWHAQGDGAVVFSNSPQGGYMETGTRPHVIRPKSGRKALRFFASGGGQVIRRSVDHPGTKPMPWFFADQEAREGRMLEAAREAVAEVLGSA